MSYVLGTGKRLSIEDVLLLSQAKPNLISLDEAAVARFATMCVEIGEKETSNFYPVVGELKIEKVKASDLSVEVRRAAILIKLYLLFNGKSAIRPSTLNCLASLINNQITPYFSSFEKSGLELIEFFSGKGFASTPDNDLISATEALQMLQLTTHPFTIFESVAFIKHPFLLMGLATVVIGGASQLARVADPISALSIEAKGACLDPFDSAAFETFRQHRGQITSANNIRIMLEGSKRTGSSATVDSTFCAFHNVPQIHGPNHDVIAQALK
jgi:histidine ammonia-lyase